MSRIATLSDRIRNTPGLGRDTVAVAVAIAAGLTATLYVLAHQHVSTPWQHKFSFSADFSSAPGVRPQAVQEVRVAGVPVGRITAAKPNASGTATLTMQIDPAQKVYDNAQLILRTKSPLNIMYVELNPGGPPGAPLKQGATIPLTQTSRAVQPYEVLDKLDDRTRAALTSLLDQAQVALKNTSTTLPAGLNATTATMQNWQPVIDALDERRANISKLVSSISTIATAVGSDSNRLTDLTTSMDKTLTALASRDQALGQTLATLPGFTSKLSSSMSDVNALTQQLNPTLDDLDAASSKLPKAVGNLTSTVTAVHHFLNGAAPVIDEAGPIVKDLRPFVANANPALSDLKPVAGYLPAATAKIVPWMGDLAAFTYQTSSAFSLYDANGGLGRANLDLDITNPAGGLANVGVSKSTSQSSSKKAN